MKTTLLFLFGLTVSAITYSQTPTLLWEVRYNNPSNGTDRFVDMVVDNSGNTYVCGTSDSIGTGTDYITMKIAPDGNVLWAKRFNGPGNGIDEAKALAINSQGDVCVTGRSQNSLFNFDIATVKYSSSGAFQWVSYYDDTNSDDIGNDVAFDNAGNVFVVGNSGLNGVFIKINPVNGLASCNFSNTNFGTWYTKLHKLIIPPTGNATALNEYGNTSTNYVTAWTNPFGTSNCFDYTAYYTQGQVAPRVFARSNSGDYFLGGYALDNNSDKEIRIFKMNNTNAPVLGTYNKAGSGDQEPTKMAIDASGNIYLSGFVDREPSAGINFDMLAIKFNTNGDTIWTRNYNGNAYNEDKAFDIALSQTSNPSVFTTGYSQRTSSGKDITTLKYDHNGSLQYELQYNGSGNGTDIGYNIQLDSYGSIIVSGESIGSSGQQEDGIVLKYCVAPVAQVSNDVSICQTTSTQLIASGGTQYSWSPTTGLSNPSISNPTASPNQTTTYTVIVKNQAGCADTTDVTVTVFPQPQAPTITANGPTEFCNGSSVQLSSNYASGNIWSTGETTQSITVNSQNTYSVTYTDNNNCSSNLASIQVMVHSPIIIANASDTEICKGDQVTLYGSGASTYNWDHGVLNNTAFTPLQTETYTVTGQDIYGCSDTDNITITVHDTIQFSIQEPITGTLEAPAQMNSYQWYLNDSLVATSQTYTPSANGTYTVIITDGNGCQSTSQPYQVLNVGISNSSDQNFQVYPNPNTGRFIIHSSRTQGLIKLRLLSIEGKQIYTQNLNFSSNKNEVEIIIPSITSGVYLMELYSENELFHEKLVIR